MSGAHEDDQIMIEQYEHAIAQLRQQLAESEHHQQQLLEALESSLDLQQGDEREKAEMRALLEGLADTDPSGYGAESSTRYCPYCRASEDMDDVPVEHAPECDWVKARTYLAAHPAPESGGLEAADDE